MRGLNKIIIVKGSGTGLTELSAFDAALQDAGIHDHNLITLSSIIPPGVPVREGVFSGKASCKGGRLYVVLSRAFSNRKGVNAVSGLGWMKPSNTASGASCGIFMEASGHSENEVVDEIDKSLRSVGSKRFPKSSEAVEEGMCVCSYACEEKGAVACTVVAAVYKESGWGGD